MNIERALEMLIESLKKSKTEGFEFLESCLGNVRSSDANNRKKAIDSLSTCSGMSVWAGFDCEQNDLLEYIAKQAETALNDTPSI